MEDLPTIDRLDHDLWWVLPARVSQQYTYQYLSTSQQLFKIPTKSLYQYIDEMDRTHSTNFNVIDLQDLVQLNLVGKLVYILWI